MPKSQMPIKQVNQLSPDGFSRFFMLADILSQLYQGHSGAKNIIRILDVGGGSEFFEQQLQHVGIPYELTVIDIIPKPKGMKVAYIQGDATNMEFADNSYDVVVSTDVLEHIPAAKKPAFVRECLRVCKEVCIIAAPFHTDGVNEAEIAVDEFNKKLFGSGQDWLEEHLELGKPSLKLLTDALANANIPYDDFGTQNLHTWLLNTHINLIEAKLGLNATMHRKINNFYNQNILNMGDCVPPTYRHIFVAFKDASKQRLFNKARYTEAVVDGQKVAQYTSDLMGLLADTIASLSTSNAQTSEKLSTARQEISVLNTQKRRLEETVAEQGQTLETFAPVIKFLRTPPIRKTYNILKRNRGKG